ncbi:putative membrane protein (TIGR02234 family) [Spinactinospora alkalitolerans]|uniref:Putative membrane protein (TIGR02234 family) n=1 Tax=Spinactinospora alkalitolerans TaxID=687207 RepID=A0A852TZ13_9ACTN|nr:Trp biosynthesis-associated membrane protein [Spinactinospora alkalitolerans]NYE48547.1 putative membrane protein (TIGR02234 family) [Spinactinospora alkalitolerans]
MTADIPADAPPAPSPAPRRREYALTLALTVAGAAGLLAATGQTWANGLVELPEPLAPAPVELAAAQVSPAASALGWASLAALAALAATRGWARRLVGALIAVFGLAALLDIWRGTRAANLADLAAQTATADGDVTGVSLDAVWPWTGAAGALLLLAVGLFTVLRGAAWPAMGSRYDRHGASRAAKPRSDDPVELWRSLDSGADPTADPARPDPPEPPSRTDADTT